MTETPGTLQAEQPNAIAETVAEVTHLKVLEVYRKAEQWGHAEATTIDGHLMDLCRRIIDAIDPVEVPEIINVSARPDRVAAERLADTLIEFMEDNGLILDDAANILGLHPGTMRNIIGCQLPDPVTEKRIRDTIKNFTGDGEESKTRAWASRTLQAIIKQWMKQCDLDAEGVAQVTGIKPQTVHSILAGHLPDQDAIDKLREHDVIGSQYLPIRRAAKAAA